MGKCMLNAVFRVSSAFIIFAVAEEGSESSGHKVPACVVSQRKQKFAEGV